MITNPINPIIIIITVFSFLGRNYTRCHFIYTNMSYRKYSFMIYLWIHCFNTLMAFQILTVQNILTWRFI